MPSSSEKQARTMRAIAHGWKPKHGDVADIPMSVAQDFMNADMAKERRRKRLVSKLMEKPND